MNQPELTERFSRQTILPGVGAEGQAKWASSSVALVGEGIILEAVRTALVSAGLSSIKSLSLEGPEAPESSLAIILTEDPVLRRSLSRRLRTKGQKALFGWNAGSSYALFPVRHQGGNCPCLECFEVMNPKVFGKGTPSGRRLLGAAAASEALQWILVGSSPLEGKVWLVSPETGSSFRHQVTPSPKCPARLLGEGAKITP